MLRELFKLLRALKHVKATKTHQYPAPARSVPGYSQSDIEIVMASGADLVRIINESLKIANTSKNPHTKVSRLNIAHERLRELKQLAAQWPL